MALLTVGLDNIIQRKGVWSKSRPCQGGVDGESTFTIFESITRKWGPGELEFEALMRMLDNKVSSQGLFCVGEVILAIFRAITLGIVTKPSVC